MNSPRFTRFTPSQHSGEIHVRADAVVAVSPDSIHGLIKAPNETGSVIHVYGNGLVYVKESPSQVIAALRAAENTHYVTVEYVMEDGDTSSLADDCDNALALKEAQADAKIADERAEWYKRRAETGDTLLEQGLVEFDKLKADRDRAQRDAAYYKQIADSRMDTLSEKHIEIHRITVERDQLLAKLKEKEEYLRDSYDASDRHRKRADGLQRELASALAENARLTAENELRPEDSRRLKEENEKLVRASSDHSALLTEYSARASAAEEQRVAAVDAAATAEKNRDFFRAEYEKFKKLYLSLHGYDKLYDQACAARDQLLAKLKDTTAALEKANAELAAIPHDANAAHNAFINSIKSAMGQSGLYQYTRT